MTTAPNFAAVRRPQRGLPTLALLLHGTGGNEHDLIPFAEDVLPGAAILSPRGRSLDEGYPRWFRRLSEGVFDLEDLRAKTEDLASFVRQEQAKEASPLPVTAIGYSNGANMAASLLLSGSGVVNHAVLLRPMVPFEPASLPDLRGSHILIASGQRDRICPSFHGEDLADFFQKAGAQVEVYRPQAGHGLEEGDLHAVRAFCRSLPLPPATPLPS